MTTSTFNTVNLLPAYLQTAKNRKFLSSTLDQLIQPAQLERINGYVGTKVTPTFVSTSDFYISDVRPYQLAPAIVVKDIDNNVRDVISYDDLYNEIDAKGGNKTNLDRLFRSEFYSYNPQIDWDKLINYQEYFWLVTGPDPILITDDDLDIDADIVGKKSFSFVANSTTIHLANGMLVEFNGVLVSPEYKDKLFFVEGVGTAIVLVDLQRLVSPGTISTIYNENFDGDVFDSYPFDGDKTLPIVPEYITINRASEDLNPWSRYNRWVHKDVIEASAIVNRGDPSTAVYPANFRARRPIIEFSADMKLFNFGSKAIDNVDYIDNVTTDAFSTVVGSAGFYVDFDKNFPASLQHGHRVIFNADTDPLVRGKIYRVEYHQHGINTRLSLVPTDDHTPSKFDSVSVISGKEYGGKSWWFNGNEWVLGQQHDKLNQAPLFDLFDANGISYSEYVSDFIGNKIFSYDIGIGKVDPILGFQLSYRQPAQGVGSYLFENHFTSETITLTEGQVNTYIPTANTYFKVGNKFANVWTKADGYQIPVLQFQTAETRTSTIEISAIDRPGVFDFDLEVFVNFVKTLSFNISKSSTKAYVNFTNELPAGSNVLFKIYSNQPPNANGHYELPLGLTNNPMNGNITLMTLTDIQDHVQTMTEGSADFKGSFPGVSNLRNITDIEKYGRRLIANSNPVSFAQMFLGKKEHSIVDALVDAGNQYNQFKLGLLKQFASSSNQTDPVALVDEVLINMNLDKNLLNPYYYSDMVGYGTNVVTRNWTVTDIRNTTYPLSIGFDPSILSLHSTYVYLNDVQLTLGVDYIFDVVDSNLVLLTQLSVRDKLRVNYYPDTSGSYIPPTPTKLGLYPKFQPKIYEDDTYVNKTKVIQGHDGSIMVAYNDYRDDAILEFEKRVYNNIKVEYKPDLFDINVAQPGAFRNSLYSVKEINDILRYDFISWVGLYGVDQETNSTFDNSNPFTWNYAGSYNSLIKSEINGSWRSVFKFFYDTDRPHIAPWEMLGFSEQPTWWEEIYGPAPYTSGNQILWSDLEVGRIAAGSNAGINSFYSRPGLSTIIPVDEYGNLIDPTLTLISNYTPFNVRQDWMFGDHGPVETAWRRSSYWPFALQRLLALIYPASYASLMFDVSRMRKNLAGQWTYGPSYNFLNLQNVVIPEDTSTLTSGYSVYVVEAGRQRTQSYIDQLKSDIKYFGINLFHKVGGFVSQDSLSITVDAIDPVSTGPGSLLSNDDYSLVLNTSNPIKTSSISGLIIQKIDGAYVVRGYDQSSPYFNMYASIRNSNSPTINVGGVSAPYLTWAPNSTSGDSGLTALDTTTAKSASSASFYKKGQIVKYGEQFYIVSVAHQADSTFNPAYFQSIESLPITGGATVQVTMRFDKNETIQVPYGTRFNNLQDVYDLVVGYGAWLEDQGFIFDDFNADFGDTINWSFSSKEFLFWSTQNWSSNGIITLSPFANQIQFKYPQSVVDNIFDSFYDYKILDSTGSIIPKEVLSVTRDSGVCTITSKSTRLEGIYFAKLRSVQKEHGIIFNNTSIFSDTIYNVETGFYQQRMLLSGFRTANWNGDYFNPGFIYDTAEISKWKQFTDYKAGSVVFYSSNYYSAKKSLVGTTVFNVTDWQILPEKPRAGLLPNFDYKISQFSDFYNLDIDNFDEGQQKAAQHLIGYTPRPYLNNIIKDPVAQYKFYQGFIKEKGTQNAITKLSKSTIHNYQGNFTYNEEWAFRIGKYGSYTTYQELEVALTEGTFIDNPQVIVFDDGLTDSTPNNLKYYSTASTWRITPDNYISSKTFPLSEGTYADNDYILSSAGYVRLDDVKFSALTTDKLIESITSGTITFVEGDTVWIGSVPYIGWDVVRYTLSPAAISTAFVSDPDVSVTIITDIPHNISVGEIVYINDYDDTLNNIYTVTEVPSLKSFVIASDASYVNSLNTPSGTIFKFTSVRFNKFDDLPDNKDLLSLPEGTKIWIDTDKNNRWAVYEKTNNYTVSTATSVGALSNQQLGWSISKRNGSNILVSGSPGYSFENQYGRISVYAVESDASLTREIFYYLNEISPTATIHTIEGSEGAEFGYSVVYDDINFNNTGYGLIFAGAPGAQTNVNYSQSGLIKISSLNRSLSEQAEQLVIYNPSPSSFSRFGSALYVQRNTTTNKLVLVSAPGTISTGTGDVYAFKITVSSNTVTSTLIGSVDSSNQVYGGLWGNSISGSDDASVIAITQVGNSNVRGFVRLYSYNGSSLTATQEILSPCLPNSQFGYKTLVSSDGEYLFVSAPNNINYDQTIGVVIVYKNNNGQFEFDQAITNPVKNVGLKFGIDFDITPENNSLIISSLGDGVITDVGFDPVTTFDSKSTLFYDTINDSGTVYVYNRHDKRFIIGQELDPVSTVSGTNYGRSVVIDTNSVFVGAPSFDNLDISSSIYYFNKIDTNVSGWNKLREQNNLVSIDVIKRMMLVNTSTEEVITYLDVIDPLKGHIAGIADQELTYKLATDPAIYTLAPDVLSVSDDSYWSDAQVGQLWWDLSTAKYQWYEQGDDSYRKNNWGKLFPGATIDIYEWVKSPILPSEWSLVADTPSGTALGYSGQPMYPENTAYSVKQTYDSSTGKFDIFTYYFWVKNKAIVPSAKNRRISAYDISSMIFDPTTYGLRCAAVISENSLILSNVAGQLQESNIDLNIAFDTASGIPKHTEWLLLQEGSATSVPNAILEKKLFDSLLGHDSLGNDVPDRNLSPRIRYGIEVRPRQGMFKDRLAAIRNLMGYANDILAQNIITGIFDFGNLTAKEEIPLITSNLYDQIVEDNDELATIDTNTLSPAELSCTVSDGRILGVSIVKAGLGYLRPPTVTIISSQGQGAVIETQIDSKGRVVSITIENSGNGYVTAPRLDVRPFTVMVQLDNLYIGKWAKFEFDTSKGEWIRRSTQSYNTSLYWKYVDWASDDYNQYLDYTVTVDYVYQTTGLLLSLGNYVKVNDNGLGNYIILKAVESNGTFSDSYDIVYAQNGTIQILDSIWNQVANPNNYDQTSTYDQTLYDQTPDVELTYMLNALRDDLFINQLKVHWNLFFFKAVKFAFTEQKLLDWAFKTSFISITNLAGSLGQPVVYKLTSSTNFEQYIKEVKPYHTQLRTFTENYSIVDPSQTLTTDFENLTSVNQITSNPVREMDISIKFDRISRNSQLGSSTVVDKFVCNGSENSFELSWLAQPDKRLITVTLDGLRVLWSDYTIRYYTKPYNSYTKKFCEIVFLNEVPNAQKLLQVTYSKGIEILSATDRIINYYSPSSGNPGEDLGQLMTGIDYPGTQISTLPFSYSTDWDVTDFEESTWGNSISYYFVTTSSSTATTGSNVLTLSTTTGVALGQRINIISTTTNVFNSVNPTVTAITGTTITVSTTLTTMLNPGAVIEFWSLDSNSDVFDSLIDGGDLGYTVALGTSTTDIIIDGAGFYTAEPGYAPEELVPGRVSESLGINVYTKSSSGAPTVYSGVVQTRKNQIVKVPMVMGIDFSSLIVTSGNNQYSPGILPQLQPGQYTVVVNDNSLYVNGLSTGTVTYTGIDIGGGSGNDAGVIDYKSITTVEDTAQVISLSGINSVGSVYVQVMGFSINELTTSTNTLLDTYYVFTDAVGDSERAAIIVYNIKALTGFDTNLVQVWFFASKENYFNKVETEIIIPTSGQLSYTLAIPPGAIGPVASQVIVEQINSSGARQLLVPPETSYYEVASNNLIFDINSRLPNRAPPGSYRIDNNTVAVYVNGFKARPGFDYTVDEFNNQVILSSLIAQNGDAIAVVDLYTGYNYNIDGSTITFSVGQNLNPSQVMFSVMTFTNHDGMLIQTDQFAGNLSGRFTISRTAVNTNCVWVWKNGIPLQPNIDYTVLDDSRTIQLADSINVDSTDSITVMSITDKKKASTTIAYRIFNDMFGRTNFKRISSESSTYLTEPLFYNSTSIHIKDADAVIPPNPFKKVPGVVMIAGERIEFFKKDGTVLSQLRRGTLGTSPKYFLDVMTQVIDQSSGQTVPYFETTLKQVQFTTSTSNVYTISTSSLTTNVPYSTSTVVSDGITLSANITPEDQVQVYYGGRLLNKSSMLYQDPTIAYDSPEYFIAGTIATENDLPATVILTTAYIVTSTNQVWVYTNSVSDSSINGYTYTGLNYLPPEFSINSLTQEITLNIKNGIGDNIKLVMVKKQVLTNSLWNNGVSILESDSAQAKFLQSKPARLPDEYYFGGNRALITGAGFELTDINDEPLEGL